MGTSISSTKTHKRILQQRNQRQLKKQYQKHSLNNNNQPHHYNQLHQISQPTPSNQLFNNNHTNQSQKFSYKSKPHNQVQNFQINLKGKNIKTNNNSHLESQFNQIRQSYFKKQNLKETHSPDNQKLHFTQNKAYISTKTQKQSSMQQIHLIPNQSNPIHINPFASPRTRELYFQNSIKNINSNKNITKHQYSKSASKDYNNQQMEKQKSQKKVQQTKKYIEQTILPNGSPIQQKSNRKIQGTVSNKGIVNYSLSHKTSENKQVSEVSKIQAIKLKTQQQCIDDIKISPKLTHYKQVGSSRKSRNSTDGKYTNSLNLLDKKY